MCRSANFYDDNIKNVNKTRWISQNSLIFTYQIISFDVNLHASCFSSLNFVKFIVKFKKFEHFIFLILFYFFTGTMHVLCICYLCCVCTNEIRFYSVVMFWWDCNVFIIIYDRFMQLIIFDGDFPLLVFVFKKIHKFKFPNFSYSHLLYKLP